MRKNGKKKPSSRVPKNLGLVERIAYNFIRHLPPNVLVEDLIQSGVIGLIQADIAHDPSLGASFETYAGIRIRGAMFDMLRKSGWQSRSVLKFIRKESTARRNVENKKYGMAKNQEVAKEMGMPFKKYQKKMAYTAHSHIQSLNSPPRNPTKNDAEDNDDMLGRVEDHTALSPLEILEQEELLCLANLVLSKMCAQHRFIFKLYLEEELSLIEIGNLFFVSESRACQMLGEATDEFQAGIDLYTAGKLSD